MKNWKKENIIKYIPNISFFIFFILMIVQYLNVFVSYDDYGFASLSYSNSIEGVNGLNYNLSQLLHFLYLYYMDWGGRVISFGTEALLLKNGVIVMQIAMAITVTFIFYFLYKIITLYQVKNKWFVAILLCSLFGLIHIGMLRDSFYWYTAAVIYVTPFLPYLIGIYFYSKYVLEQINNKSHINSKYDRIKNLFIMFILFIAAFSQEQVAISLSFAVISIAIYKYIKLKKLNLSDYINVVATLLGTLLVVFAPGNSKRMDEKIDFYNTPLIERTLANVNSIFKEIFGYKFMYIMTAYIVALLFISIIMLIKKYGNKIVNIIFLLLNFFIAILYLVIKKPLYDFLEGKINSTILLLCIFLYILFIMVQITIYYIQTQKQIMLIMFWASMCTIASMAFIPAITIRCYVPFVILSFGIIADLVTQIVENIKYPIIIGGILLILIVPFSYKNYYIVLDGYKINSTYHINNDNALTQVSQKIKSGEEIKSVTLQKLNNTICSNIMQYEEGFEFIKVWMCEYYDIPQDIEFVWVNES